MPLERAAHATARSGSDGGGGVCPRAPSGWESDRPPCEPSAVGCVIGSGIGGMNSFEGSHDTLRDRGSERVSPLAIPLIMGNAASGVVAMRHGLRGPVFGVMSACASGTHAIGTAAGMAESGEAPAVVAGGADPASPRRSRADCGSASGSRPGMRKRSCGRVRDPLIGRRLAPCLPTRELEPGSSRARIQVSPLREYLERLLDFATRSRWGKRPIARVEALRA